jgi:hypothetical protein
VPPVPLAPPLDAVVVEEVIEQFKDLLRSG